MKIWKGPKALWHGHWLQFTSNQSLFNDFSSFSSYCSVLWVLLLCHLMWHKYRCLFFACFSGPMKTDHADISQVGFRSYEWPELHYYLIRINQPVCSLSPGQLALWKHHRGWSSEPCNSCAGVFSLWLPRRLATRWSWKPRALQPRHRSSEHSK